MVHNPHRTDAVLVCIVEDEPLIRMDAADLIAEAGYETIDVPNADEAIKLLESRDDIRVVLTDVDMPGSMDGLKLAHAIRDRWPPVEIIVVSGHVKPAAHELPSRGVFFTKPYNPERLLAEIKRFTAA